MNYKNKLMNNQIRKLRKINPHVVPGRVACGDPERARPAPVRPPPLYVCVHMFYVYIYTYTERERERVLMNNIYIAVYIHISIYIDTYVQMYICWLTNAYIYIYILYSFGSQAR